MEDISSQISWFLLPVVVAFSFLFFIYYRIQRENKVKARENELKRQTAEMEMRSLRAQMNPHFIFNCLQSIHQFIEHHENEAAGDYLLKFSKLIRLILENSLHEEIALEDELEALILYMDLEKLRIKGGFEYEINVDSAIDAQSTYLPPLLLQPFIENSIWHGFAEKSGERRITIQAEKKGDHLLVTLADNGVKNTNAIPVSGKKKSLGVSLTGERIELLNKSRNISLGLKTEDVMNGTVYAGKKTELILPYSSEK